MISGDAYSPFLFSSLFRGKKFDVIVESQRIDHEFARHKGIQAVAEQNSHRHKQAHGHKDRGRTDQQRGRQASPCLCGCVGHAQALNTLSHHSLIIASFLAM